ncbi:hypothetical protein LTR29_012817 [Friedmanniomyces endolithicus]|nr:hypothetical protein LTR29_012817 [Friedmanniomyces endolithicus]
MASILRRIGQAMINWVQEKPGLVPEAQTVSLYNETGARRRRTHQKSRKGCVNCKKKRVKCDEIRPGCGQCAEKKWPCEFQDAELPPKKAKRPTVPSVRRRQSTPPTSVSAGSVSPSHDSREWLHTQVLSFMERRNMPDRQLGDSLTYKRLDAVELVDHFIDYTDLWIGSSTSQGVIQRHGFEMALESEHLLHAMLACSAKHLSHLHPDVKKYDVAATLHYTRSLQAYSAQLCYDLEQGNANAMLATSGLLAKLTFINTPTMSANRPLAADNGPTAWIRSMQGVRTIMSTPRLRAQLEVGFMFPILQKYAELVDLPVVRPRLETSIVDVLRRLCKTPMASRTLDSYTAVIDRLEPLVLHQPTNENVDQYMAWVAGLEPTFIELLERNDTRALLILLCWCAKLPLIEQWWTSVARIEFLRISAHLSSVDNPLVQQLLSLAAQCDVQSPRDAKMALGSGTIPETVAAVVLEEPFGRRKGP